MSMRSFKRLGSSISVLDFIHIGSSVSLRSFGRLGASLSLFGMARFGSTLAVLDIARLGARTLRPPGWKIHYDNTNEQITFKTKNKGFNSMTITTEGGDMHGSWFAESIISTSDRRWKTHILPIEHALRKEGHRSAAKPLSSGPATRQTASWVLRELRPVSFVLRPGSDSKATQFKYGFAAKDLARVAPGLVRGLRGLKTSEGGLGVVYQDLLALLAAAGREQQARMEQYDVIDAQQNSLIESQSRALAVLEEQIRDLRNRFLRLRWRHPVPPRRSLFRQIAATKKSSPKSGEAIGGADIRFRRHRPLISGQSGVRSPAVKVATR